MKFWQRIGKVLTGEIGVVSHAGSLKRVAAVFVQPPAGPDGDEGKVRPLPRQNLVPGDLDLLIQDLQFPIADQCLMDQARKHRIIVKLFYPELSRVFRAFVF